MKPLAATILAAALAACAASPEPSDANRADTPPAREASAAAPASGGGAPADTGRIAQLEREARALARVDGCTAGACRTAPVGSRPCGGPRAYLVYCAATTDSAALFAKLDELKRAEEAFNRDSGMASTCEFRNPPTASIQGGRCVAVESREAAPQ